MKKLYTFLLIASASMTTTNLQAQTTAMNFVIEDCNGSPHELYDDLDAGKAVIIEFFMTSCSPCVTAGDVLEVMKTDLMAEFPGMIKAYAFGYNNSYSCSTVLNWVNSNGYVSVPSDSGATQVAYYGGMGMPTIVILGGGTNHSVLGSPYIGFSTSDTTTMANDIRNFMNGTSSVNEANSLLNNVTLYPNPSNADAKINFTLAQNADVKIEVLDLSGRIISAMNFENTQAGVVNKSISTADFAEGNYIVRVHANGSVSQQKLNVVH